MMDPIIQFSQHGGELVEVTVPGAVVAVPNPENEVDVAAGIERTMCVYIPKSGVPHPKQAQVLMVLRDGNDLASAQQTLADLGIAELAEREHVIVVFPNPLDDGWNYTQDAGHDDDTQFIVRCFAVLKPTVGVSGFNGMIFHLACSPEASAVVWALAAEHPLDAAAVMLGAFPEDFAPAVGKGAEQVAWLYEHNAAVEEALAKVNGADARVEELDGRVCHVQAANPNVTYHVSDKGLDAAEVEAAWAHMFAGCRRWRNDDSGTYQARIDFEGRGFTPHVQDTSLGLADGLPRTWFEYVPPQLRGTTDPVPLVFYFHGINCCGLYGAEQSGWADIADRDDVICVFPDATVEMRWNAWADSRIPTDIDFVLALIEHIAEVHPIDRTRIYVSGFSMGSMFSNALAGTYPDVFAGAVALNGPHISYLSNLDESIPGMLLFNKNSVLKDLPKGEDGPSPAHKLSDEKRAAYPYRMPFVQFAGIIDNVGFEQGHLFPVTSDEDSTWGPTVAFWKRFNNIPVEPLYADTASGFAAPREVEEGGEDARFIHQAWQTEDEGKDELYHYIVAKRMPHAVDLREVEIGWEIVKHYARQEDGSLARID